MPSQNEQLKTNNPEIIANQDDRDNQREIERRNRVTEMTRLFARAEKIEQISHFITQTRDTILAETQDPTYLAEQRQFHNLDHIEKETIPNFFDLASVLHADRPELVTAETLAFGVLALYGHDLRQNVLNGKIQLRNESGKYTDIPYDIIEPSRSDAISSTIPPELLTTDNISKIIGKLREYLGNRLAVSPEAIDLRVMRIRAVGDIEKASAEQTVALLTKNGIDKENLISLIRIAIKTTIPGIDFVDGKIVYQPFQDECYTEIEALSGLENREAYQLATEMVRLSDLATAALDPKSFLIRGTALWFEENLDATAQLAKVKNDPSQLSKSIKDQTLQRLKDWANFQVLFIRGQQMQIDTNLKYMPEPTRVKMVKLFEDGLSRSLTLAQEQYETWNACTSLEQLHELLPFWPS